MASLRKLIPVGIVGGFLAGTALVAIICIILILIRKQRLRGSSASSSFRSRTRTRSSARPPIPVMSESFTPPLIQQPLRVHTGDALTAMSHDLTTAGTVGHPSTGMHQFPLVGPGSASSRTTSFGQHSSGTSSGGSNAPNRAPQIPSLGLSNSRPFLPSFGSLFSYHASTGHPTPTATRTALNREEQTEQVDVMEQVDVTEQADNTEHSEQTEQTEVTAPSTFGSRTLAATEEIVRSDDHARTEETGLSEDVTRTAETAHSGPADASADTQPKSS
ncbi:transmembrane protein, putative [Rhizoctonia solani AG-3 Rhs1AP]|uniref:Transmembrane protein, putative n=2 Tax=Rhizoctonia solani AG-3 TaxID=1086053 RepID=X8J716_9AGAM|nr:transmembrane protein, putative [Rhizoctonia solani AG-3 Rhs1AP]KEP50275.1 putative transmembrane protein [Rhizoctonia solani 123E]